MEETIKLNKDLRNKVTYLDFEIDKDETVSPGKKIRPINLKNIEAFSVHFSCHCGVEACKVKWLHHYYKN